MFADGTTAVLVYIAHRGLKVLKIYPYYGTLSQVQVRGIQSIVFVIPVYWYIYFTISCFDLIFLDTT